MALNYLGNLPRVTGSCQSDVILSYIHDKIQYMASLGPSGTGGLATEATLQSVLDTLQDQSEFFEVLIQDANGDLFFMVRTLDETTGSYTISYINADGTAASPVAPLIPYSVSSAITPHTGFASTLTETGSGIVLDGPYSVVFHNTGASSGIVNGAPIASGASRTYTAAVGKSLPAISFDATGTTLVIEILNY